MHFLLLKRSAGGACISDAAPRPPIMLSDMMKRDWAAGKPSSKKVQEYAAGAAAEGNTSSAIRALSKAAAGGACPQNAQRNVMRTLGQPVGSPDMFWVTIPITS